MTQSVGRYRVGVGFNPSGADEVIRLKEKAAAFIDECDGQLDRFRDIMAESPQDASPEAQALQGERAACYHRAMREAESAAMWAVKAATKRPRK